MKIIAKAMIMIALVSGAAAIFGCSKPGNEKPLRTFQGYITAEDDFAAGNGQDTAQMVHMDTMAKSGLGITCQSDGKWVFYYFGGDFATKNSKGNGGAWKFDGRGAQEQAWSIVEAQVKNGRGSEPVAVTVTGTLSGEKRSNPGSDQDGKSFEVISVKSIATPVMNNSGSASMSSHSSSDGMSDSMKES